MATNPLTHADTSRSDEQLAEEARAYREDHKDTQFICWLLTLLRSLNLPWWTPTLLREAFPSLVRMMALAQRPDIRQTITTVLVGLPRNTARILNPTMQAQLLDQVVDNNDVPVDKWEAEFTPEDLAAYMDKVALWHLFRGRLPLTENTPVHQDIACSVMEALLLPRKSSTGKSLGQILTEHDVVCAIERRVWQTYIPIETRMAIDEALLTLEREKKTTPFHAKDILGIATPRITADTIPLKEFFDGILDAAEKAMGLEKKPEPVPEVADATAATTDPGPEVDDKKPTTAPAAPSTPPTLPDIPSPPASPTLVSGKDGTEDAEAKHDVQDVDMDAVEISVDDDPPKPKGSKPKAEPPALPKITPYISNEMFEKAGGTSASSDKHAPKDSQASSSLNSNIFEIEGALDIELPVDIDLPNLVLADIKLLIVDKKLIDDENRFRDAIIGILPHLSPKHPKDGDWKQLDFPKLRQAFFDALDEHEKGKPIRISLVSDLVKKGPPPRNKFLPPRSPGK
ncbi:hypothetical protein L0Y59_02100 [Candidatus Uhrbacteria bacterium]|nr:hypothetical protein [Candidatus Uhrbacteria bacterium]